MKITELSPDAGGPGMESRDQVLPAGIRTGFVEPGVTTKDPFASAAQGWKTIPEREIRDKLSRILGSSIFVQSARLCRFLQFTVNATLASRGEMLKEYSIGTRTLIDSNSLMRACLASLSPRSRPVLRIRVLSEKSCESSWNERTYGEIDYVPSPELTSSLIEQQPYSRLKMTADVEPR